MKKKLLALVLLFTLLQVNAQWADISIPIFSPIKDVHFIGDSGYAITGFQSLGTEAQVYKTSDHGLTWMECTPDYFHQVQPNGVANWSDYGSSINLTFTGEAVHFFNDLEGVISLTVLVEINDSTPQGVSYAVTLKTIDGGATWYEIQNTNDVTGFTQFVALNDSSFIIHRHGDIFRSYDKGESLTEIFDYSFAWDFDFDHIVLGPDNHLYAGVNSGGFDHYGKTMLSEGDGTSWTAVFQSFPHNIPIVLTLLFPLVEMCS